MSSVNIKNPGAVLSLAYLNGAPPATRQEVEEAMDQILLCWSDSLAEDEAARMALAARIAGIVALHLEGQQWQAA